MARHSGTRATAAAIRRRAQHTHLHIVVTVAEDIQGGGGITKTANYHWILTRAALQVARTSHGKLARNWRGTTASRSRSRACLQ